MANQWFKFYGGEYLSDPKIENLTGNERSCWLTLLCLASSSSELGTVEFMTVEILLKKSGIEFDPYDTEEWDRCLGVLKKFERMKMIELADEGTITIINWDKRQEHNLTPAERMAKMRAKRKDVTSNVTNVTLEENRREENRIEYKDEDESSNNKVLFSEKDLELAKTLLSKIKENTPTFKEPNLENWAEHIRLMRERDNRTPEQIDFVIKWCQQDNFWNANILSTKKLREKFDTLVAQIKRNADKDKIKKTNVIL